jgi:hypothetical protein
MLSYLQPQLTSEPILAICSTSSDEENKAIYPNEDDTDGIFNPAAAALVTTSSSRLPYSQPYHHRSPVPFVYGHTPTPTYGFGFSFYEDMSSFTGKIFNIEKDSRKLIMFI